MIEIVEVYKKNNAFSIRERLVNPDFVVDIKPCNASKQRLIKENLREILHPEHNLSQLTINKGGVSEEIIVIKSISVLRELFQKTNQVLLG